MLQFQKRAAVLAQLCMVGTGVVCLAPQAQSQEMDCKTMEADLDRLACYDKQSGRTPVTVTQRVEPTEWVTETKVSKLTDEKGVYLSVSSKEPVLCRWNNRNKATLVVRCHENKTSVYLTTECHMVSSEYNDYGDVTYRIDENPSKSIAMDESTDNRALGLWSGGQAIPFIKQMLGGQTMVTRFTPYNDSPVTAEFNISGLDKAIIALREQCKW